MSLLEFVDAFENNLFANTKELTKKFNELKVEERKTFLIELKNEAQTQYDNFIEQIRGQVGVDCHHVLY